MKKETSCGAVIFRRNNNKIEYLIIKQKNESEELWYFPKGHIENNETEEETALREVYEEVGLKIKLISGFREAISYTIKERDIFKTVVFFLSEVDLDVEIKYIFNEVETHLWLPFGGALDRLSYQGSKNILEKANLFLQHFPN